MKSPQFLEPEGSKSSIMRPSPAPVQPVADTTPQKEQQPAPNLRLLHSSVIHRDPAPKLYQHTEDMHPTELQPIFVCPLFCAVGFDSTEPRCVTALPRDVAPMTFCPRADGWPVKSARRPRKTELL
ncbi:hypothetical protein AAFF_G00257930 [Aldrovandia affinis]|uniref:Uncharacterized protein n=1 Tax=Aldrovandia affinis TaxID=143900 RepID=A0AAD7STA0_9TELE|nr:hypothetical protein AAFF_G00257930 [Aldrovandia affinis]